MADLGSGLATRVDTSQETARLRVAWIDWASPFRGMAVGVGDTILAVDGVPVDPLPGGYAEARPSRRRARRQAIP